MRKDNKEPVSTRDHNGTLRTRRWFQGILEVIAIAAGIHHNTDTLLVGILQQRVLKMLSLLVMLVSNLSHTVGAIIQNQIFLIVKFAAAVSR